MKKILLPILLLVSLQCISQQDTSEISLSNQIKINFDYDSLSYLSCKNSPQGIYAIIFNINKDGNANEYKAINDSVCFLNRLFIDAIDKSILSVQHKKLPIGEYIQFIYFDNLSCNLNLDKNNSLITSIADTSNNFSVNYEDVSKFLSNIIESIENSIVQMQNEKSLSHHKFLILPFAIINNHNPNLKKNKRSFRNDIKRKKVSPSEINVMEKLIEQRKRINSKNK